MNVPVSVGPPRASVDKSQREVLVYDVIVNPKVILEAEADKTGGYRWAVVELYNFTPNLPGSVAA
jgi:hypothetical protein